MRTDLAVAAAVVGALIVSVPVYWLVAPQGRAATGGKGDWSSLVLGRFAQEWCYWVLRPVERAALWSGLGPLFFNLAGVAAGVAAGVLFATGRTGLAGWAILVGGTADILDGQIARARGLAGPRGAVLDSTLDRFAEVAVFVGLAAFFATDAMGLLFVSTALGGSLLVSYARARGESVGVICPYGLMQRAERLVLMGFGAVLDDAVSDALGHPPGALLKPMTLLVALGAVGTAVYRTVWIASRLRD